MSYFDSFSVGVRGAVKVDSYIKFILVGENEQYLPANQQIYQIRDESRLFEIKHEFGFNS